MKNEEILPTQKEKKALSVSVKSTQAREKQKIESRSQVIFIEAKPAPGTLNQLISRVGLANINLIFFFRLHIGLQRKSILRKIPFPAARKSINCRTFFIIERREFFFMEKSLFLSQSEGEMIFRLGECWSVVSRFS